MLSDGPEEAVLRRMRPDCVQRFPGAHHFLVSHPEPVGKALRKFLDGLEVQNRTE
jgi:hypothetical protein